MKSTLSRSIVVVLLLIFTGFAGLTQAAKFTTGKNGEIVSLDPSSEREKWVYGMHPTLIKERSKLQSEWRARLEGKNVLYLNANVFDPRQGIRGFTDDRILFEKGGSDFYLIQFKSKITERHYEALKLLGYDILTYIPERALLVDTHGNFEGLHDLADVRWYGEWLPAFKYGYVSWQLLEIDKADPVFFTVEVFPGVDLDRMEAWLRKNVGAILKRIERPRSFPYFVVQVRGEERFSAVLKLVTRTDVYYVSRWYPPRFQNHWSRWTCQGGDPPFSYTPIFDHGLKGKGQVVAVMDSGLASGMKFFRTSAAEPATLAGDALDWNDKTVEYINYASTYDHDECSYHGTHVAGSVAGDDYDNPNSGFDYGDGSAPLAKILFQDVGSVQGTNCSLGGIGNLVTQIGTDAYKSGTDGNGQFWEVRVHTNSWGSSGNDYSTNSSEVDQVMWEKEDMVVLFAAANDGSTAKNDGSLANPASAKNDITVAALHNGVGHAEDLWWFSSRGPAADGRIEPDVGCPGDVLSAAGSTGTYDDQDPIKWMAGTSMATPTCAGLTALVREYFREGFYPCGQANCTNAQYNTATPNHLIKAVILAGAEPLIGIDEATGTYFSQDDPVPNNQVGYGRMNLERSLYFDGDTLRLFVQSKTNANGLTTGQADQFTIDVSNKYPLRIVLNWTDPWGTTSASRHLINDLDLIVTAPDGTVYRGNQWSGTSSDGLYKASAPNATGTDTLNNTESVYIENPIPGTWTIRVNATDVPGNGSAGTNQQGYSVAVVGRVFTGGTMPADLLADSVTFTDSCDSDGYIDNGERGTLSIVVKNYGAQTATAATVSLTVDATSDIPASQISITPSSVSLGDIASGGTATAQFTIIHTRQTTPPSGILRLRATYSTGEYEILQFHFNRDPDVTVTDDFESGLTNWTVAQNGTGSSSPPFICTSDTAGGTLGRSTASELKFGGTAGTNCGQNYSAGDNLTAYHSTGAGTPAVDIPAGAFLKRYEFFEKYQTYTDAGATDYDIYRQYLDVESDQSISIGNTTTNTFTDMIFNYRIGPVSAVRDWGPNILDIRWTNDPNFPYGDFSTMDPSLLIQGRFDVASSPTPRIGAIVDDVKVIYNPVDNRPADTTPPTFAGIQSATPSCTPLQIDLSWNEGVESCSNPVTYNIYRSTTSGFTPDPTNRIASGVTTLTYSDTNVVDGTTYYYIVRAVDALGNEDTNTIELSATLACSVGPPGEPVNLQLSKSGGNLVFSWTAVGSTCSGSDYALYQGDLTQLPTYTHDQITCTTGGATNYSMPIPAGTSLYYIVTALTSSEEGSYGRDSSGTERPTSSTACKATTNRTAC